MKRSEVEIIITQLRDAADVLEVIRSDYATLSLKGKASWEATHAKRRVSLGLAFAEAQLRKALEPIDI